MVKLLSDVKTVTLKFTVTVSEGFKGLWTEVSL